MHRVFEVTTQTGGQRVQEYFCSPNARAWFGWVNFTKTKAVN